MCLSSIFRAGVADPSGKAILPNRLSQYRLRFSPESSQSPESLSLCFSGWRRRQLIANKKQKNEKSPRSFPQAFLYQPFRPDDPKETRTPVAGMKTRSPRPLDDGADFQPQPEPYRRVNEQIQYSVLHPRQAHSRNERIWPPNSAFATRWDFEPHRARLNGRFFAVKQGVCGARGN